MEDFTDVDYIELNLPDDIYLTAVDVAKILKIDVSVLRSWTKPETFENELNIKRVNGRRVFTKQDVENLQFIKNLRDKNYQIKLIKEWVSKKGFKYAEYDGGLIDTKDPMGFNALAESIMSKNKEQLMLFVQEIIKENVNLINTVNNKIDIIDDRISKIEGYSRDTEELTNEIKNEVKEHKEISNIVNKNLEKTNENLSKSIENNEKIEENINKTLENNKKEMIEENKKYLEELKNDIKYISQEELKRYTESQHQGIFSRLFGKKNE